MNVELDPKQKEAVEALQNGYILCGGVGTGKTRTSLAYYYYKVCKGSSSGFMEKPTDLYVITTAKKRDSGDWESEALMFDISSDSDKNMGGNSITVDSWNNIEKYKKITDSFFIFDEQRVKGKGPWVKSFLAITKHNKWILLSATPGDTWIDYVPVFLANGFYKSRTEFNDKHCIFNRFVKWPQIDKYVNEGILYKYKNQITVKMDVEKKTLRHHINVTVPFDKDKYKLAMKSRWNPFADEPIDTPGILCYVLRRVVNDTEDRINAVLKIFETKPRLIIFYNFNYELDRLKEALDENGINYAEWNGKKHEELPKGDKWGYLVQYLAGAEGWNCITTNAICFYSLTYSYAVRAQSEGRIDRFNTPYENLYYYHIRTMSPIDMAIERALNDKKIFNEKEFVGEWK